jgi:hypothetical protein
MAYGLFHRGIEDSVPKLTNVFSVSADQDRLHYAEEYALAVMRLSDLGDFTWFRRGVLLRETLPTTQKAFHARNLRTDLGSIITRFGELWCFTSLLHDIGYLFEGEIPNDSATFLDEPIRDGIRWAYEYFEEIFWDTIAIRSVDERKAIRAVTEFGSEAPTLGGAGTFVQFLRDLGPMGKLNMALNAERERGRRKLLALPSDAFRVWAINYRAFNQDPMARRIELLEEALYGLIKKGVVGPSVRVLDHGICGGLLLLKCSTYWFRLIFALKYTKLQRGSLGGKLQKRLLDEFAAGAPYHAMHWWKQIVWASWRAPAAQPPVHGQ